MPAIKTIIADDEPAIRDAIAETIRGAPGFEVVATCADGEDALRQILALRPDAAFLDIKMPRRSGLDVVDALDASARPLVVFVTAFEEHAVAAFDVSAIDFLVKPYARARLLETLDRLRQRCAEPRSNQHVEVPGIVAVVRGRRVVVPYATIRWIEAAGSYARVHVVEGPSVLVRTTLTRLMEKLPEKTFLRVHRSNIVSVEFVRMVEPTGSGDSSVVLDDGTAVSASRTYGAALRSALRNGGK